MSEVKEQKWLSKPLPATVKDWIDSRKTPFARSLNDQIEELHLRLLENPKYVEFLAATGNEEAKEGSMIADDFEAAAMIRAEAEKRGNAVVAGSKKATIRRCLAIILHKYRQSRKERRYTVGDEVIEPQEPNGE